MSFETLQNLSFQCTALKGMNKAGLIKPDASGYRTVVLGALDVFNVRGEKYMFEGAQQLFEGSSILMRKIANQALRGENGHPAPWPGMTTKDYLQRLNVVREERICVHIRKVWLDFENIRDRNGNKIIAIMGEVKPAGELGYVLEEAFNNPDSNVAFSIRCFTERRIGLDGIARKWLRSIVTWDHVSEPGIAAADKFCAPGLESADSPLDLMELQEGTITKTTVQRAMKDLGTVGLESARMDFEELCQSFGWDLDSKHAAYRSW